MSYSFPPPQSPLALGQAPSSATRTPSSRSPLGTRAAPAARFLSKKSGRKVDSTNTQHDAWVQFQQGIVVDGFETGQITEVEKNVGMKKRGGKMVKKKLEKERMMKEAQDSFGLTNFGGGEFPAERWSDEETARLLTEAYANLPKKDGKRGSRKKKRDKLKFHLIRRIHAKQKAWRIKAHFRKMDDRSRRWTEVKEIKANSPEVCRKEADYQEYVMRRWAEKCLGSVPEGSALAMLAEQQDKQLIETV